MSCVEVTRYARGMNKSSRSVLRTKSVFPRLSRGTGTTRGHYDDTTDGRIEFRRSNRRASVRRTQVQRECGITWEVQTLSSSSPSPSPLLLLLRAQCATFPGICWCNGQCICLLDIVTFNEQHLRFHWFIIYISIYNCRGDGSLWFGDDFSETPQLVEERCDIRKRVRSS